MVVVMIKLSSWLLLSCWCQSVGCVFEMWWLPCPNDRVCCVSVLLGVAREMLPLCAKVSRMYALDTVSYFSKLVLFGWSKN